MKKKKRCFDSEVSDEDKRLSIIYILCESALEITAKLRRSKSYNNFDEVNADFIILDNLVKRIRRYARNKDLDIRVGGTD